MIHYKKHSCFVNEMRKDPWQKRHQAKLARANKEVDYTCYWKNRNGIIIPYINMTTTHLENTYKMLERMMCSYQNKCHDINDAYDPPEWVEIAMNAIEKELGTRELKE